MKSDIEKPTPPEDPVARLARIRGEYEKVRSQICNCPWNPDGHANDCPVNVLDRVIVYNLK